MHVLYVFQVNLIASCTACVLCVQEAGKALREKAFGELLPFYAAAFQLPDKNPESSEPRHGMNEIIKESSETRGWVRVARGHAVLIRGWEAASWLPLERGLESTRPGPPCLGPAHTHHGRNKQGNYRGSGAIRGAFARLG